MITGAISGVITAILAMLGVKPTPVIFGAIWLTLKFLLFMAVFLGMGKLFDKKKPAAETEAPAQTAAQGEEL